MKKLVAILLTILCLCLSFSALCEEETIQDYRRMPGYTSYPMYVDSEDYYGHFCLEVPMEWDGGDMSFAYGVPTVMLFKDQAHIVMIAEMTMVNQYEILQEEDHMLYGFLWEGMKVSQGISTEGSKILEQFDIHGIPATRVEMVGQGYEMVWIMDRLDGPAMGEIENFGNLWFFMYPTDPDDAEYTEIVKGMIDSFTICGSQDASPYFVKPAEASDFEYTDMGSEIRLDAYVGEAEYVLVPDEIDGKPVTSLGDGVFYETNVRNVVLPYDVGVIGKNTFGGCNDLVYVTFGPLETLPQGTFESCFRLHFPDFSCGVKKIEDTAFWGNMFLNSLFLPADLEEIDQNAFVLCDNLAQIWMEDNGSDFYETNEDGTILMSADGEQLVFYSWLNDAETYQVPEGVKQINSYAFQCAQAKEILLPEGLESIGMSAFERTQITELTIPASVTEIGPLRNLVTAEGVPTEAQYTTIGTNVQVIHGTPGTAAEKYAEIHKLTFVAE